MVAIQLNILTPVGTAIRNVIRLKNGRNTAPVVNMWCAQTEKPEGADAGRREHERLVAEQRLAQKTGSTSLMIPIAGRTMM